MLLSAPCKSQTSAHSLSFSMRTYSVFKGPFDCSLSFSSVTLKQPVLRSFAVTVENEHV